MLRTIRLVAAVAAAALLLAPAGRAAGDCSPASDWPSANSGYAAEVVALVNDHRASLGLGPLQISSSLAAAAVWKARHMAEYLYMQHDDPAPPVARSVGSRLSACGYGAGTWGENIAYGYSSPQAVVNGWLASAGHRANIENPAYNAIGVGAAASDSGTVYWAQDFGVSGSPSPPPQPDPPADDPPAEDPPGGGSEQPAPTPTPAPTGSPIEPDPAEPSTPPADEAPAEEPAEGPPASLLPVSVRASSGTIRSGAAASLAADDGRVLVVRSAHGVTVWRATVPGVSNDLELLRVVFRGSSSASCRQAIALWSFARRAWVTVATRASGRTETKLVANVVRNPADFVAGSGETGAVRVRATCVRRGEGPLTARADLLAVTFGL